MRIQSKTQNVKNHATAGEKKAMPLAHIHKGHMRATGSEPNHSKFGNTSIGKTRQDYGNQHTQVIRSS